MNLADFTKVLGIELTTHQAQIGRVFECMDVVEEELAAALSVYKRRRGHAAVVVVQRLEKQAFKYLAPGDLLRDFGLSLYRAHVRELIDRIVHARPLDEGTDAEVLAVLSRGSTVAPPGQDYTAAMHRLFKKCLPEEWKRLEPDLEPQEPHEYLPGGAADIIEELRRKLARERDVTKRVERR
jgi:hypothetical protein